MSVTAAVAVAVQAGASTSFSRTNVDGPDRLPQRGTPAVSARTRRDTAYGSAKVRRSLAMPVTTAVDPDGKSVAS